MFVARIMFLINIHDVQNNYFLLLPMLLQKIISKIDGFFLQEIFKDCSATANCLDQNNLQNIISVR